MCAAFSAAQAWTGAGQRRLLCTIMDAESFERVSFERLVSSASFLRAERVKHVAVTVYRSIIQTFDITSDLPESVSCQNWENPRNSDSRDLGILSPPPPFPPCTLAPKCNIQCSEQHMHPYCNHLFPAFQGPTFHRISAAAAAVAVAEVLIHTPLLVSVSLHLTPFGKCGALPLTISGCVHPRLLLASARPPAPRLHYCIYLAVLYLIYSIVSRSFLLPSPINGGADRPQLATPPTSPTSCGSQCVLIFSPFSFLFLV